MQLKPEQIKCEFGELVGDAGCHCKIEDSVLQSTTDRMSMAVFCMGDPLKCPTLRKEKDGGDLAGLQKEAAKIRISRADARVAREERVRVMAELLKSDTPEGRAWRARIDAVIRRPETQARLRAATGERQSGLILPPGMG